MVCGRRDEASFCAVIDGDGEVADFLRLPHVMKRRGGWNRDDAELKVTNLCVLLLRSFDKLLGPVAQIGLQLDCKVFENSFSEQTCMNISL